MIKIGKRHTLEIVREAAFGVYLDGENLGEILLPNVYLPAKAKIGDKIEVFIYCDSDDELAATTKMPKVEIDECAYLKASSVNQIGAFLDWGLKKELFVPYSEQREKMIEGNYYVVCLYQEPNHVRIAASSKIDKRLSESPPASYASGQEVDLLVYEKTDIGYKAIINHMHIGLLYQNELFQPLKIGQSIRGYIKKVRDDLRIDLSLQKPGFEKPDKLSEKILDYIEKEGGFVGLTDKSDPKLINKIFGVSKKKFKIAIGALYKKQQIKITDEGLFLKK